MNAHMRETADEAARRETFADDTSTGRLGRTRRSRRAIIAAAVEGRDYDWWLAFCRNYFPGVAEVKSADILRIIGVDPLRARILQGLADSRTTIVIIDFSEFTASLVRTVYEAADMKLDADPLDILEKGRLGIELTQAIIRHARRAGLEQSTVSRIEWLFHEAMTAAPVIINEPDVLVNRDAYDKLDPKAKEIFLAHFSIAFGEALDPRRQANFIANELSRSRFLSMGNFAYKRLEGALTANRTFDQGSPHAIGLLTAAHEKMVDTLDQAMYNQLKRRAGTIKEEDSRNAIGIQVADVAAGFAAREYEAATGEVPEKTRHIRAMFDRVLLNDKWI